MQSLFSRHVGQSAITGQRGTESGTTGALDAGLMARQLWVLAFLLGLMGTSSGRWPQTLDFFHGKTELSHLVMDEAVQEPLQGHLCLAHPSTKSTHYCPNPLMHESPKLTSCNLARTYFETSLPLATTVVTAYFKANI